VAVPEAAVHEAPYFPDKEMTDFLASLGGMLGELGELGELGWFWLGDFDWFSSFFSEFLKFCGHQS